VGRKGGGVPRFSYLLLIISARGAGEGGKGGESPKGRKGTTKGEKGKKKRGKKEGTASHTPKSIITKIPRGWKGGFTGGQYVREEGERDEERIDSSLIHPPSTAPRRRKEVQEEKVGKGRERRSRSTVFRSLSSHHLFVP